MMEIITKIQALQTVGKPAEIGRAFLGLASRGWLEIKDLGSTYFVRRTDGMGYHSQSFDEPSIAVYISKSTGQLSPDPVLGGTGAWQSAWSMNPVYNHEEGQEIFDAIKADIAGAYDFNRKKGLLRNTAPACQ